MRSRSRYLWSEWTPPELEIKTTKGAKIASEGRREVVGGTLLTPHYCLSPVSVLLPPTGQLHLGSVFSEYFQTLLHRDIWYSLTTMPGRLYWESCSWLDVDSLDLQPSQITDWLYHRLQGDRQLWRCRCERERGRGRLQLLERARRESCLVGPGAAAAAAGVFTSVSIASLPPSYLAVTGNFAE